LFLGADQVLVRNARISFRDATGREEAREGSCGGRTGTGGGVAGRCGCQAEGAEFALCTSQRGEPDT